MMNKWKVPLNKPFFSNETKELVMNVLNSGMVSQGEMVEQFEEEVRKYVGAKYALAVSSCTAGMWMILTEMRGHGDEDDWGCASIPAFTFPAARLCAEYNDMIVENVDVSTKTYNAYSKNMLYGNEMVIPIHQFGMPCDMDTIRKESNGSGAFVLEDAACALGSRYKGKMIGSTGTAVFSFHGRKILTTGEGGMIVTDDEELYEQCLLMRQFGRDNAGHWRGHGLNFKMSDVAAAMGIGQMKWLDAAIGRRREIAETYNKKLNEMWIDGYQAFNYFATPYRKRDRTGTNWQSYVIKLHEKEGVKTRDDVLNSMRANGIEVQVGSYDNSHGACKNSAQLAKTTLALPIWTEMTMEDIDLVINALEEALA